MLFLHERYEMPSVNLVGFIPVNELRDQPMHIRVNETLFLGFPTSLPGAEVSRKLVDDVAASVANVDGPEKEDDLAPLVLGSFNVVMVVQHCRELEMMQRCVQHICTVFKREELRIGYLTDQCRSMFRVREAWLRAQQDPNPVARPSHADLSQNLLACSSLARELQQIYDGLSNFGTAHVRIGGWITLSLSLDSVTSYPAFPIRPYQSLLIVNPSVLPADASPDLLRFVGVCKPSKSFQDLQMELNVPLSQIFRMSAHLLYWRVGKVRSRKRKGIFVV